jgi:TPR repeat protein
MTTYFDIKKLNTTALSLLFVATFASQPVLGMKNEEIENNTPKNCKKLKEELSQSGEKYLLTLLKNAEEAKNKNKPEKAKKYLKRYVKFSEGLGKEGNPVALLSLANIYEDLEKSSKANKLVEKASMSQSPDAIYEYALFVKSQHENDRAVWLFEKLDKLGDLRGTLKLAEIYIHGLGVERDLSKSVEYLEKAASKGGVQACFGLVSELIDLNLSHERFKKIIESFEKEERLGNVEVSYHLGLIYNASSESTNIKKAIEYFEKAANGKHIQAHFNLVKKYLDNDEVDQALNVLQKAGTIAKNERDIEYFVRGLFYINDKKVNEKALKLIHEQADLGNGLALRYLIEHYAEGTGGVLKNEERALEYCIKIWEKTPSFANNLVFNIAYDSYRKNDQKVLQSAEALYVLGVNSYNEFNEFNEEEYDELNEEEKFRILQRAASLSHPGAIFKVGQAYLEGRGVAQNTKTAIKYLETAATLGSTEAKIQLADLYLNEKNEPDPHKAIIFLKNLGNNVLMGDEVCGIYNNMLSQIKKECNNNYYEEKNNNIIEKFNINHYEENIFEKSPFEKNDLSDLIIKEDDLDFLSFLKSYATANYCSWGSEKKEAVKILNQTIELAFKNKNAVLLRRIADTYYEGKKNIKKNRMKAKFLYEAADSMSKAIPLTFKKGTAQAYKLGKNGIIGITTDNNVKATYQARTIPVKITPGNKYNMRYEIELESGKMSVGALNTKGNNWLEEIIFLNPGFYSGVKEIVIPKDETETSLVLRNYHLSSNGGAGESKFTVRLGLEEVLKSIPLTFKKGKAEQFNVKNDGILEVTTDINASATYQVITNPIKVTPGEIFNLSSTVNLERGKMSLGILNTKGDNWLKEVIHLTSGSHADATQIVIPEGETQIWLVLRNYHLLSNGGAGQSKFTAKIQFQQQF